MAQKMKFQNLYNNCKKTVQRTLNSMWCGEAHNDSQKAYIKQLQNNIIPDIFASEQAMPIVQYVKNYPSVTSVSSKEAQNLVGNLWAKAIAPKDFAPYEHQYQSWKALLKDTVPINGQDKHKSIVVTTGTGSGKTECFMLPLVKDLLDEYQNNPQNNTQAIFIYPLNALMEDQKDRMQKLLTGTGLKFAVYNGDMPEKEPDPADQSDEANRIRKRIDLIKGIVLDDYGNPILDANGNKQFAFPNVIATREALRDNPAHILLTNPTMLEYIMLRKTDTALINPNIHSLRWISIDETHSYTGSGAAELAMLIRRVLMAFNVKAENVRFTTSSATIGDDNDPNVEMNLKKFIAQITGQTTEQIAVISDKSVAEYVDGKYAAQWKKLIDNEFVKLDELYPGETTVSEKLALLDKMCDSLPDKTSQQIKVHFFFRVPNNGLFVQLDQHQNGSFSIHTELKETKPNEAPMLELVRCKHCGEFLTIAQMETNNNRYSGIPMDDSDMFDLDDPVRVSGRRLVLSLSNKLSLEGSGNASFTITENTYSNMTASDIKDGEWRVVGNTQKRCPCCGTSLSNNANAQANNQDDEENGKKLQKFRLSSEFISRIIAPCILDETIELENCNEKSLHQGQQFISFVDSRQDAATSSLSQNLEQERMWVYCTIFHNLCKKKNNISGIDSQINELKDKGRSIDPFSDDFKRIYQQINDLEIQKKPNMTWGEIYQALSDAPESDIYAWQFAKRREKSAELDEKGNVTPAAKQKYILSIMVEYLSRRPKYAASPETMGLFTPCYEKLKGVTQIPQEVTNFNTLLTDKQIIGIEDWNNFLQVFIDYTVRSNESIYLHQDNLNVDIFDCRRFATQKPKRDFVHKPEVKDGDQSRMVRYLAQLLVNSNKASDILDAIKTYKNDLKNVMDALWNDLTQNYQLLQHSECYKKDGNNNYSWQKDDLSREDSATPYRLNVADMSFKLYEDVKLCDVNTQNDNNHSCQWRPVEVVFKNFSPYLLGNKPVEIDDNKTDNWEVYPHFKESKNKLSSIEDLNKWAKEHRKLMWDNGLWAETGLFADRLNDIYLYPNLFVEAEHTAQVDKIIARRVQDDFKKHKINILACSTTMEMGVHLGDLEIVMMQSVPPHPSNYKQRAGRAGRNDLVRSACITLCASNAVGLRTLNNPLEHIFNRPIIPPYVDLGCLPVIQRHVNAFLIREFGAFADGDGSVNQKVLHYYTSYNYDKSVKEIRDGNNNINTPNQGLGDSTGTRYAAFNNSCDNVNDRNNVKTKLEQLLHDVPYAGSVFDFIDRAKDANISCYEELKKQINGLKRPFSSAKGKKKQRNYFERKYKEYLTRQLVGFWATHRFTPNANMPVNVVSFDVNNKSDYRTFGSAMISNPSYDLRAALSQYVPGNRVVVDGAVHIVRGVRSTDFYSQNVAYKQLYRNSNTVRIDDSSIPNQRPWRVNGQNALTLIQPKEYLPDVNESETRIQDQNIYTQVDAQLIGTGNWSSDGNRMFQLKSSNEQENARILYYNVGRGYGYCHCFYCGRTVLEDRVATDPNVFPRDMNTLSSSDDQPNYHNSIRYWRTRCEGCNNSNPADTYKRNVILGDLIQTDFTEIKIKNINGQWINHRDNTNDSLLYTLGIVFTQAFASVINKNRNEIDFTITPNGHICIFDTNPGGSGYSNRLKDTVLFNTMLDEALKIVKLSQSNGDKLAILDRYSMRYADKIDIESANDWLESVNSDLKNQETSLKQVFPICFNTSLSDLKEAFKKSNGNVMLFCQNDYENWNYGGIDVGWCAHFFNAFVGKRDKTTFFVLGNNKAEQHLNMQSKNIVQNLKSWTAEVKYSINPYNTNDIYPVAFIDGVLYFTTLKQYASLNEYWGGNDLYATKIDNLDINQPQDINSDLTADEKTLIIPEGNTLNSQALGDFIHNFDKTAKGLIDTFIDNCNKCNDNVSIICQDEHVKSVLSMVLTLQLIEYFVKKINKSFSIEFKVEEYYDSNSRNTVGAHYENDVERNEKLRILTESWLSDLKNGDNIVGNLVPIKSSECNSMVHWREISFTCGSNVLTLYPDGGVQNEWAIDNSTEHIYYTRENTNTLSDIPLKLTKAIKFGVKNK